MDSTSPNCLYPAAVITIPRNTTSGLLKMIPMGKGNVSRGHFAYLVKSGLLTNGGITFETILLIAFMKDQPRTAPDTLLGPSPWKSTPWLET